MTPAPTKCVVTRDFHASNLIVHSGEPNPRLQANGRRRYPRLGLCAPNERGLDVVAVEQRDVLLVCRPDAGRDVETEPLQSIEEKSAPHAD
jgi:hypothetical protein